MNHFEILVLLLALVHLPVEFKPEVIDTVSVLRMTDEVNFRSLLRNHRKALTVNRITIVVNA